MTADHFYLPRDQQDALVELLSEIPALCEDLAITLTRQDRIGSQIRTGRGSDEQPLPYSIAASDAADILHDTLAAWVRHTCEQRIMRYTGSDDTLNLARWLKRWIVALALSPGADEAPDEINHAIRNARRACDRPTERPRILTDEDRHKIDEADHMILGTRDIATLAKQLGGTYTGLTQRRVRYLTGETQLVHPVHTAGREKHYLVGDIRRAHHHLLEQETEQGSA